MRFIDKYSTVYFLTFFLLLAGWSAALFLTNQKTSQWNFLFNTAYALLYLSGGITASIGTKLHGFHSSVGKELFSIAIGMCGFAVGLLIWSYYNMVLKVDLPYPSLADLFFVLYIPFIAYGILNLLREFGMFFSKRIIFESLGIFLVSGVFIFFFGNPPDLSPTLPLLTTTLNIFYLLGDAFLITIGLMLIRLTRGHIHISFFFFIAALFIMALADFVFAYRTGALTYWNGDISDLLFALSGCLFSLGVAKIVSAQLNISRGLSSNKSS